MVPLGRRSFLQCTAAGLAAGCAGFVSSAAPLPSYFKALTLEAGKEWRFNPLLIDINGDGHLDLVATARLVHPGLHMWLGDGKGGFSPVKPTWTDIGYGALATGDINGDGFPDIVVASHFGAVQTLLNDGKGGFTEKVLRTEDGYVAAQLADINEDGSLELILIGFQNAGVEIYFGDGKGNWKLHNTLPDIRPEQTMPGRALVVGDLNNDGHLDLVAAFQRLGVYVYYGDGRGRFSGGPATFRPQADTSESLVLGDVNKDSHPDIVVNGNIAGRNQANGPDAYLGDGHGGWKGSSAGLKLLKYASPGVALGDLDGDGNLDIVAAGNSTGNIRDGCGLFWFRGDGRGRWAFVPESGLPSRGLSVVHSITLADVDQDGSPEIVALSGGENGAITIWKRQ
jgi:FG-GAP-like repeat